MRHARIQRDKIVLNDEESYKDVKTAEREENTKSCSVRSSQTDETKWKNKTQDQSENSLISI